MIGSPPLRASNYDKHPTTVVDDHPSWGSADFWTELSGEAFVRNPVPVIAVDCYPGVEIAELLRLFEAEAEGWQVIDVEEFAARPIAEIDRAIAPYLTDDRVFGVVSPLSISAFYEASALERLAAMLVSRSEPVVLVGWGASLVPGSNLLVLADLARWEIQTRQRAGAPNWRSSNTDQDILTKYKRGFFVEWRAADAHKLAVFERVDYWLDTNRGLADLTLTTAAAVAAGFEKTVGGPFRVVPFFDPGVWGGQWMKAVCGLDDAAINYAWCFDCVPEENSLYLEVGGRRVELPSKNLVLQYPQQLLGADIYSRFGAEFPIRFDFLDTMGGGNLSLQVHPMTEYIRRVFGMAYTQDESYYILDAAPGAEVYLGLKTGVNSVNMLADLRKASAGKIQFPADLYVNTFPATKHDHFLIPAGTVHCSGANSMVLEVSATPFIFTFKMWDWDRVGLDGLPRPINIEHAAANIQWDRDTNWTERNLVNRAETVASGEGWVEERTGLHDLEFIETRRHWFTESVPHDTQGTLNVINLVEGEQATVESPDGLFEPFVAHYAETFIVPAQVGRYTITPSGPSRGARCGTLTAYVRGADDEPLGNTPGL
jgi:mannose-6-phosphate isomerase class I